MPSVPRPVLMLEEIEGLDGSDNGHGMSQQREQQHGDELGETPEPSQSNSLQQPPIMPENFSQCKERGRFPRVAGDGKAAPLQSKDEGESNARNRERSIELGSADRRRKDCAGVQEAPTSSDQSSDSRKGARQPQCLRETLQFEDITSASPASRPCVDLSASHHPETPPASVAIRDADGRLPAAESTVKSRGNDISESCTHFLNAVPSEFGGTSGDGFNSSKLIRAEQDLSLKLQKDLDEAAGMVAQLHSRLAGASGWTKRLLDERNDTMQEVSRLRAEIHELSPSPSRPTSPIGAPVSPCDNDNETWAEASLITGGVGGPSSDNCTTITAVDATVNEVPFTGGVGTSESRFCRIPDLKSSHTEPSGVRTTREDWGKGTISEGTSGKVGGSAASATDRSALLRFADGIAHKLDDKAPERQPLADRAAGDCVDAFEEHVDLIDNEHIDVIETRVHSATGTAAVACHARLSKGNEAARGCPADPLDSFGDDRCDDSNSSSCSVGTVESQTGGPGRQRVQSAEPGHRDSACAIVAVGYADSAAGEEEREEGTAQPWGRLVVMTPSTDDGVLGASLRSTLKAPPYRGPPVGMTVEQRDLLSATTEWAGGMMKNDAKQSVTLAKNDESAVYSDGGESYPSRAKKAPTGGINKDDVPRMRSLVETKMPPLAGSSDRNTLIVVRAAASWIDEGVGDTERIVRVGPGGACPMSVSPTMLTGGDKNNRGVSSSKLATSGTINHAQPRDKLGNSLQSTSKALPHPASLERRERQDLMGTAASPAEDHVDDSFNSLRTGLTRGVRSNPVYRNEPAAHDNTEEYGYEQSSREIVGRTARPADLTNTDERVKHPVDAAKLAVTISLEGCQLKMPLDEGNKDDWPMTIPGELAALGKPDSSDERRPVLSPADQATQTEDVDVLQRAVLLESFQFSEDIATEVRARQPSERLRWTTMAVPGPTETRPPAQNQQTAEREKQHVRKQGPPKSRSPTPERNPTSRSTPRGEVSGRQKTQPGSIPTSRGRKTTRLNLNEDQRREHERHRATVTAEQCPTSRSRGSKSPAGKTAFKAKPSRPSPSSSPRNRESARGLTSPATYVGRPPKIDTSKKATPGAKRKPDKTEGSNLSDAITRTGAIAKILNNNRKSSSYGGGHYGNDETPPDPAEAENMLAIISSLSQELKRRRRKQRARSAAVGDVTDCARTGNAAEGGSKAGGGSGSRIIFGRADRQKGVDLFDKLEAGGVHRLEKRVTALEMAATTTSPPMLSSTADERAQSGDRPQTPAVPPPWAQTSSTISGTEATPATSALQTGPLAVPSQSPCQICPMLHETTAILREQLKLSEHLLECSENLRMAAEGRLRAIMENTAFAATIAQTPDIAELAANVSKAAAASDTMHDALRRSSVADRGSEPVFSNTGDRADEGVVGAAGEAETREVEGAHDLGRKFVPETQTEKADMGKKTRREDVKDEDEAGGKQAKDELLAATEAVWRIAEMAREVLEGELDRRGDALATAKRVAREAGEACSKQLQELSNVRAALRSQEAEIDRSRAEAEKAFVREKDAKRALEAARTAAGDVIRRAEKDGKALRTEGASLKKEAASLRARLACVQGRRQAEQHQSQRRIEHLEYTIANLEGTLAHRSVRRRYHDSGHDPDNRRNGPEEHARSYSREHFESRSETVQRGKLERETSSRGVLANPSADEQERCFPTAGDLDDYPDGASISEETNSYRETESFRSLPEFAELSGKAGGARSRGVEWKRGSSARSARWGAENKSEEEYEATSVKHPRSRNALPSSSVSPSASARRSSAGERRSNFTPTRGQKRSSSDGRVNGTTRRVSSSSNDKHTIDNKDDKADSVSSPRGGIFASNSAENEGNENNRKLSTSSNGNRRLSTNSTDHGDRRKVSISSYRSTRGDLDSTHKTRIRDSRRVSGASSRGRDSAPLSSEKNSQFLEAKVKRERALRRADLKRVLRRASESHPSPETKNVQDSKQKYDCGSSEGAGISDDAVELHSEGDAGATVTREDSVNCETDHDDKAVPLSADAPAAGRTYRTVKNDPAEKDILTGREDPTGREFSMGRQDKTAEKDLTGRKDPTCETDLTGKNGPTGKIYSSGETDPNGAVNVSEHTRRGSNASDANYVERGSTKNASSTPTSQMHVAAALSPGHSPPVPQPQGGWRSALLTAIRGTAFNSRRGSTTSSGGGAELIVNTLGTEGSAASGRKDHRLSVGEARHDPTTPCHASPAREEHEDTREVIHGGAVGEGWTQRGDVPESFVLFRSGEENEISGPELDRELENLTDAQAVEILRGRGMLDEHGNLHLDDDGADKIT